MFNKENKSRFMTFRENNGLSSTMARQTFNRVEDFEIKLNKDVYNFTLFEIKDMYKTLNIRSISSLRNVNSTLSLYTTWAINENLVSDAINHYTEMTTDDYVQCINSIAIEKRFVSRKELLDMLKMLSEPSDKFLLLAAFEGITGKDYCELTELKIQDLDINNRKAHLCTGRIIDVSKELIDLAQVCVNTFKYICDNGKSKTQYELEGVDLIIKDFPQSKSETDLYRRGRRTYARIRRIFDWLDIGDWMTINALSDSGKVEWLKKKKVEGYNTYDFVSNGKNTYVHEAFKNQFGSYIRDSWYEKCKGYIE